MVIQYVLDSGFVDGGREGGWVDGWSSWNKGRWGDGPSGVQHKEEQMR